MLSREFEVDTSGGHACDYQWPKIVNRAIFYQMKTMLILKNDHIRG